MSTRRRCTALVTLAIGALHVAGAQAGAVSPCFSPYVFAGAEVQVFVLPDKAENALSSTARSLVNLLHRQVLFSALRYPSIAVVELEDLGRSCPLSDVMSEVNRQLKPGFAAIFLQERVFEQSGTLYLQSTLVSYRKGEADAFSWDLGAPATGLSASVATPTEPLHFAPREIPTSLVGSLQSASDTAMRAFAQPSETSPSHPLRLDPHVPLAFGVLEARPGWMRIELPHEGGDCWIAVPRLEPNSEAAARFPELFFVNALVGYYAIGAHSSRPEQKASLLASLRSGFGRYLESSAQRPEARARALAALLDGNATLLQSSDASMPSVDLLSAAQRDYQQAREMAPSSTAANSFYLAATEALCAREACPAGADSLHREFLEAVAADPTSAELIGNLRVLYQSAEKGVIKLGLSPPEIANQVRLLSGAVIPRS